MSNITNGLTESKSVVEINDLKLGQECRRLPYDYLRFANLSADARRDVDEAKADLELTEAEVSAEIRANPEDHGVAKVTEAGLKELVAVNKRVQQKAQILRKAQHEANLAAAVVSALDQKKNSLKNLVELHGMGYFAEVRPSAQGKAAVDEFEKRATRRSIPPSERER